MPIYEYECRKCGNQFEHLFIPPRIEEAVCPQCQSTGADLERVISRFATTDEGVTNRQIERVKKESHNLQYERHQMERRIAREED